jgi:hypothetical protein
MTTTVHTELLTFIFSDEIDEDENDIGILYETTVSVNRLSPVDGEQFELVFTDKTHNGISYVRIHNFMVRNGIYKSLPPAYIDNEVLTSYSIDGKRHVRMLAVEGGRREEFVHYQSASEIEFYGAYT